MALLERPKIEIARECGTPVLKTARLVMRAPCFADAQAVATLLDDKRIAEMTARIPHPYSLADAESFIATTKASAETVFLITLPDDTIIGAAGIMPAEGKPAEIGYWLGVDYWGRGYATEAIQQLVDYAFDEAGHTSLLAGARVSNPASRRVLEKCGFQWTGVELWRIRSIATSAPLDRFRLDRGIWEAIKRWGKARAN